MERPARPVTVYSFDLERDGGRSRDVRFSIACSKGTYIRSLAHDLVRIHCMFAFAPTQAV